MKRDATMKYAAAVTAVVLFLGLTVWLVRNEGRQTRESIHEAAKEAGSEVRKGLVEGAERVVDKAAEVPARIVHDVAKEVVGEGGSGAKQVVSETGRVSHEILGDVKDILRPADEHGARPPSSRPDEEPSPQPSPKRVPSAPQAKEPPKPAQSEGQSSPVGRSAGDAGPGGRNVERSVPATPSGDPPAAAIPPPRVKPARPADPIGQLFDLGHQMSKAVDEVGQEALALSWEEEQQVGREVQGMVARAHQLLRPPIIIERLQRLARPIADQRTRKEVTFTLSVIKSDEARH